MPYSLSYVVWLIPVIVVVVVALIIIIAVFAFIIWKKSKENSKSNTTKMNEHEQKHDVATYETVFDSGRQPDVLTRSPLYEETSVVDNPSYGVVSDQN